MSDLFEAFEEAQKERAGIQQFDGGMTREQAEEEGHRCRVRRLLSSRASRETWHVEYLEILEKKDPARCRKERADANAQWESGNRGARGDWR